MHAARPADCPDRKGTGSTSDSSEKRRGNLRHRQSASYRRTRIRCQAARQHSHHPVAFVSPPRISWGVSENRRDRSDRSSAGGPGGVKFLMGQRRGPLEARNVAGLFVQDCIMYPPEPYSGCMRP
ncbi:hypothetical protein CDO25_19500 (plasmid) [Sinorhizobium meliloti]|nr:hypothetical protein CDO25_19500 [Sinorhizobium meliloti]